MSINKTKVKEFLERFISGDMEVVTFLNNGLCRNLSNYCTSSTLGDFNYYTFVSKSCVGWSGITERNSFPIQRQKGVGLFEGSQLEQRISLAKHLLTKVDDYEG